MKKFLCFVSITFLMCLSAADVSRPLPVHEGEAPRSLDMGLPGMFLDQSLQELLNDSFNGLTVVELSEGEGRLRNFFYFPIDRLRESCNASVLVNPITGKPTTADRVRIYFVPHLIEHGIEELDLLDVMDPKTAEQLMMQYGDERDWGQLQVVAGVAPGREEPRAHDEEDNSPLGRAIREAVLERQNLRWQE
jgi:hypothetical protein